MCRPAHPHFLGALALFSALCVGLLLDTGVLCAADEQPFQIEVNVLAATVMAGDKPIGAVKQGAKLAVRQISGDWYLIDLPDSDPPQAAWVNKGDVRVVIDENAGFRKRLANLTDAEQETLTDSLRVMETKYDQLGKEGRFRDALPLGEQLLTFAQKNLGERNSTTATMLDNMGLTLMRVGDYSRARKCLEQSLSIRREVLGEKHSDVAHSLNRLGVLFEELGDNVGARDKFEQALAINLADFGEEHLATADTLNNIGTILDEDGQWTEARKYYERSLAIRRRVAGEDDHLVAQSLCNLGTVAQNEGDYATARRYVERALAIDRAALGEMHPETAGMYHTLATVLEDIANYSAAWKCYGRALAINEAVFGEKSPNTAEPLYGLAGLLLRKARNTGDYSDARKTYEEVIEIRKATFGENNAQTARALIGLGVVLSESGSPVEARKCFERVLAIRKSIGGEKQLVTAVVLENLARSLEDADDLAEAEKDYKQALAIYQDLYKGQHPAAARVEIKLGHLFAAEDRWSEAAELFQQSRQTVRRHLAVVLPSLSEMDQLEFLKNTDEACLKVALTLGLKRHDDPHIAALSAGWLLNGKGTSEEALAERAKLLGKMTDPAAAELLAKLAAVRTEIAKMNLKVDVPDRKAFQIQLDELASQERQIGRELEQFGTNIERPELWASMDNVRRQLPPDAVLVDIARFDPASHRKTGQSLPPRYAVWLIPPAGQGEITIVDLGLAEPIDELVKAARTAIGQASGVAGTKGLNFVETHGRKSPGWQEPMQALAGAIFTPLVPHLGGARRLVISPDGPLWLVPWAALPLGPNRFAIEQYEISYAVSGRDLLRRHEPARPDISPALIMADPDFDLEPDAATSPAGEAPKQSAMPTSLATRGTAPTRVSSLTVRHVARLPGTAAEAAAIVPGLTAYTRTAPQVLLGKLAVERTFKSVHHPRVVVLSTHGYFLPDQEVEVGNHLLTGTDHRGTAVTTAGVPIENPLLRCGLLLAGCNRRGDANGDDDGVLTGLEIVGTDLRGTDLVVLSACETGLGDVHMGQGVAGLRQAFQLAGAKAVVATLWQISDEGTVPLMTEFFSGLGRGQAVAEALRNAQLGRIQALRKERGTADPFFWAAFSVTGG